MNAAERKRYARRAVKDLLSWEALLEECNARKIKVTKADGSYRSRQTLEELLIASIHKSIRITERELQSS